MRAVVEQSSSDLTKPLLLRDTRRLVETLQKLTVNEIEQMMKISPKLTIETKALIDSWTVEPAMQRAAVDSFLGDIYSGLQAHSWSEEDRTYAQVHLRILSGLYGILKPLDGIYPYRHEMGYKIPNQDFKNMYDFWGEKIASTLPKDEIIVNLTAVEYGKTITKYVNLDQVVTPKFLTISSKTGEPTFVTVHAKIARGAFVKWLIENRIVSTTKIRNFSDLGYRFDEQLSKNSEPVFVCQTFEGLGLSIRQT